MSNEPLTIAKDTYRICLSDIQRRLLTLIVQDLTDDQIKLISNLNRDYNELSGSGSNSQTVHSKVLHHLLTHTLISHALILNGPTNLITPDALKETDLTEPELREHYAKVHELKQQIHALIFKTEITPISSTRRID